MSSRLKQAVKSLTAKPFWLRYLTLAPYRVLCAGASALTGLTMSGSHPQLSVEEAVEYIRSVFDTYKAVAKVHRFHGSIAEVGPGDSSGVGLMFLADGCEQVDLVDRFFSTRDQLHQQAINRTIVEHFPQLTPLLRNGDFSETSFEKLARHYGKRAAAETFFESNKSYDFIVSCAVLGQVYDPLRALSVMASALKSGGMMIHQVDGRDRGQFSEYFHELKFLELPHLLYSPLKWRGGANRVRLGSYLKVLQQERLESTIYVTTLAGNPHRLPPCSSLEAIPQPLLDASRQYVCKVRTRLAKPFRDLPDDDLMVTSFTLLAAKRSVPDNS